MMDYEVRQILEGVRRDAAFTVTTVGPAESPALYLTITPEVAMRQALRPGRVELTPEYLAKIPAEDMAWLAERCLWGSGEVIAPTVEWARYSVEGCWGEQVYRKAVENLPDLTLESLPTTWLQAAKAEVVRLEALAAERKAEMDRERQVEPPVVLEHIPWWQFWRRW